MARRRNQDVTFRMIRGRVVPIKKSRNAAIKRRANAEVKRRTNKIKRGTGFIAAGLGTSFAGGVASGLIMKKATKEASEAIKFYKTASFAMGQDGHRTAAGMRAGEAMRRAGMRRHAKMLRQLNLSKNIFKITTGALAGAIISRGISEISEGVKGKDLGATESIGTDLVGFGAAGLAQKGLETGIGKKTIAKILSRAL